ncbi:putative PHD type zinc finger protein with BAH domain-containing protein, partial [Tulasnella sp. 419]
MPPPPKEHIVISNGEKVHVNDHVYVSPPWELRDGIPYSIARIMEFLPDEGQTLSKDDAKGKGKERQGITRVRLAWYYRPSDLSDRAVADSRLLYAAIFSEVQPVKFLRAKCHVRHKDKIVDLNGWKRRPDRFYFSKLFDPYIKKEYEVIRSVDVNNLPPHIRNTLQARYEFVITEREMVSDLTDNIRLCGTCDQWCPATESVQCDLCKNFFHMQCVSPPLAAKPSKGYGWTCAPCTLQHEDAVDRKLPRNTESKTRGANGKGKGKQSNAAGARVVHTEDKYFKMWPYRYFGLYTVAEDTLDPDDMIFPRTTTRVGPRYQSSIPIYVGGPAPAEVPPSTDDNLPNRGGDETIEVMSDVVHWSEAEIEQMEQLKAKLWTKSEQRYNVDYLEEAIRRFTAAHDSKTDLESVKIRNSTRSRKWQKSESRFVDKDWTTEEVQIFEKGLDAYGAELFSIKGDLKGRSTAEVVRYYGKWKNARLGEEHRRAQTLPPPPPPTKFRRTVAVRSSSDPDDEGSVVNGQLENTKESAIMCGSCKTKDSTVWWKAPRGLISSIMCDTCGIAWRKYGDIKGPSKQDDHPPQSKKQQAAAAAAAAAAEKEKTEKRDSEPLPLPPPKRQKQMPPPNKHGACACCRKVGLAGTVVKCEDCGLVVHGSCYGVSKADAAVEPWLCEVCANEKHQEFSLVSNCLLCPRPPFAQAPPPAKGSSGEFLRAWKPTEGRGWVHAICAVFIPEVAFTDASRLRMVEGMSSLPKWRWTD